MKVKEKPLASLCIAFYNQERYVGDALKAAFEQDYANLEIIISDDASTDGTYDVIKKMVAEYKGPHKVITNSNNHNIGISCHFNKLVYELAHGEYIALAGGDDVSLPNRVSVSVDFLEKYPQVQSVTFVSEQVDENLRPLNKGPFPKRVGSYSILTMDDYCCFNNFLLFSGDSRMFRRNLIEFFPPLSIAPEEDLEFFVRSMLLGSVGIIRKPLVKRRWNGMNASGKPLSRKLRNNQKRQLVLDIELAYQKKAINAYQKECMMKKVEEVFRSFCEIDGYRNRSLLFMILMKLSRVCHRLAYMVIK